ncbi:SDR family NAD(P)-dependent oxidoreductase [Rhodococcus sp. USK13]|uniref:SDR family NAD(P)-dependent oxidoreductase n=1 Tax=Rhodococcus sp. USK13 TaxID=2806442 RepID=UPI001BCC8A55|nr:SDR family NAD(P)-dependent oxidoreductase [Rhodococcus sp. USK13]
MARAKFADYLDKNILITGAASGLGLALTHQFVRQGAHVILLGRSADKLEQALTSIQDLGGSGTAQSVSVDVVDNEALQAALEPLLTELGGLDVVINNAGISGEAYIEDVPLSEHHRFMETNYFGCLNVIQATLPYLKASHGTLINVASVAGLLGSFGFSAYCASKHALVGLTEVLKYELEPQGVRVHLVCPSEFMTPMVESLEIARTPENRAATQTIPRVTTELVVAEILDGIDAGIYRIIPGIRTRVLVRVGLALPGLSRWLVARRIGAVYVGPGRPSPRVTHDRRVLSAVGRVALQTGGTAPPRPRLGIVIGGKGVAPGVTPQAGVSIQPPHRHEHPNCCSRTKSRTAACGSQRTNRAALWRWLQSSVRRQSGNSDTQKGSIQ